MSDGDGPLESLFRLALFAYPVEFRRRFGDSMLDTFCEGLSEQRHRGKLAIARYGTRSLRNVLATGLAERVRSSRPPSVRNHARRRSEMRVFFESLLKEARFALRSFRKRPGFTLLAVSTLALGVGANTAIFSVVDAVLLEPLPYRDPGKLVSVLSRWSGAERGLGPMSYPDLVDVEQQAPSIESLVGYGTSSMTLSGLGEPVVLSVSRLTKGLMEPFRLAPALGRDLRAEDFGAGKPTIVVLGHEFWQSRFGGREDVLGKTLTLNGVSYEIVGVAPAAFDFPIGSELWIPRSLDLEGCGRGCHTMIGVGRLRDGDTVDEAQAEAEALAANLQSEYPDTNTYKSFAVRSLRDQMVADARPGLLMLLGAVGLVLLIACANVANLLLVKASTRTGEVAIRTALGASRGRLMAQTFVESSLLALFGGGAGLVVAAASLKLFRGLLSAVPRVETIAIDGETLWFTLGTLVVVTFLFGSVPAFSLLREPVRSGMTSAGSGVASPGRKRFRNGLLALETALAAVLLVGAGLLLKTFVALYSVDMGFDQENLTRFSLILPEVGYDSLDKVRRFYRDFEERIRALPGVEAAGSSWGPPLGRGHATGDILVEGRPEPSPSENREASIHSVGPGFFETMRIPILKGRGFLPRDDVGPEPVAIINERFAREIFPSEDPIGRRFRVTVDLGYGSPTWRIVGVAKDVRSRALDEEPEIEVYVPHGLFGPEDLTIVIRSASGVSLLPAVREILREADPNVPMYRVETLTEAIDREIAPTRLHLVLIAIFAVLAAVLASVGIYGVVAYVAQQRTREIGLRMALGAPSGAVRRLVVAQGLIPAVLGLTIGLVAAFLGGQAIEAVLFGVDPRDPAIFVATAALLFLVALAATFVPARRASRIDPVAALRFE